MAKVNYLLAFYEVDRAYGGPEEGGWWYDTGTLVRVFKVCTRADQANALARRANRLLTHLQRNVRSTGSVTYSGGRHMVDVCEGGAPAHFPQTRPTYE